MAPSALASAVSARTVDRDRPLAADLSGLDPSREAAQAVGWGLCAHQSTASSG